MQIEKIINTAYSFGAAVVVFGAWAKLGNKYFADSTLTAGLLTETVIFLIYGLMEWREKPVVRHPAELPPTADGDRAFPVEGTDNGNSAKLTESIQQTNRILQKIFKTN